MKCKTCGQELKITCDKCKAEITDGYYEVHFKSLPGHVAIDYSMGKGKKYCHDCYAATDLSVLC